MKTTIEKKLECLCRVVQDKTNWNRIIFQWDREFQSFQQASYPGLLVKLNPRLLK